MSISSSESVIKDEKEKTKFFVDLRKDKKSLRRIVELLELANDKNFGKEIIFRDLAVYAVKKLNEKDIQKIQEQSLSEMEKVKRALEEYNKKHNLDLELGEFLLKKLNLS